MALYLVTGGCGFIGSHLCVALRHAGHAVRVLDNLSTGRETNLAPGAELWRGDITDPDRVAAAMADVDGCFHLAAIASVELGMRDWVGTHRANLSGSIVVFDAAARAAVPVPVVYASSAAVYGDCEALPLHEDAPTRPLSAYGADKLGCELHARVAGRVHAVPTVGLRFFNVFGPRQDPRSPYSGVISIFCERLARGAGVVIHGDGGQTRDFVGVGDVVAALTAAMGRTSLAAPVFNVCSGHPTSVRELADSIARVCDVTPMITQAPARSGDIRHSLGDPGRAFEALGVRPSADLEQGLRGVVSWLRAGGPGVV